MTDIEIPLGRRTAQYRFFEILPGVISIGAIVALFVLSIFAPFAAAIFVLAIVMIMFVKAIAFAFRTIQGYLVFKKTSRINWAKRLSDLADPRKSLEQKFNKREYGMTQHLLNLKQLAQVEGEFPLPSDITHAIFVFIYKENYDIVGPTIDAILASNYDSKKLILVLAYEARGGKVARETVDQVIKNYQGKFIDILAYRHPDNLPEEVVGKGPNATYAGREFAKYVKKQGISPENVIVTTLDADNRPDPNYLPYLTYEWIVTPNRQRVSFQPICLFANNIWDVPAPMRVVATGNSFWNIISSMRPHLLRNFASHAQGLSALIGMDFWSKRTIVEDGHQYWRSYFYFDGDYSVIPLRIAIGQDAVLSDTYVKTLKAQFIQVRRWAYGASDIAFVAKNIWRKDRTVPFFRAFTRFWRLLDSHVTQAVIAPVIAFGAWVPWLVHPDASRIFFIQELQPTIGTIQMIAMFGLFTTMFTSFAMLPPRPKRYKKPRGLLMALQWVLMPVTSILYTSSSAYYAQFRLLIGKYMEKFDTTEKFVKK